MAVTAVQPNIPRKRTIMLEVTPLFYDGFAIFAITHL